MNKIDALFPEVSRFIEFETLMNEALQVLSDAAGRTWTDTDDHDPGITLLQAAAFNTSDLAYRLSLPLQDLLTPEPGRQKPGDGIFPVGFGPQQALTCGPISEDDYRRALLDLRGGTPTDGYFLFQNAQLVREPESERYEYWYNTEDRQYSFSKPAEGDAVQLRLRGNYLLYVQPTVEAETHRGEAQGVLDTFLQDHRNLGEAVSRVIWLAPQNLPLQAVIELDDDFTTTTSAAAVLAAVYTAVCVHVSPPVQRCSTAELQARGWRTEDIYQGPYLQHGWIAQLPPPLNADAVASMTLAPLVNVLLAIPGVKRIVSLEAAGAQRSAGWTWAVRAGHYPRPWGARPLEVLAEGDAVRLLAHGMDCRATADEIRQHLSAPNRVDNRVPTLPYGRWRNPARYHPVTQRVPPCYGLAKPQPTPQELELHRFLLPFEQLLANGCKQVELLPNALAFDREPGDVTWGMQWPFLPHTVSDAVLSDCAPALQALLEQRSHDFDKELACVNYLLGYFGARVAPRIFAVPPMQFLASQQGYLRRISDLGYDRANVRIDRVSALQQRIAARLGWGGAEVFNATAPLDRLPFYLVEHRALLPVQADPAYNALQSPAALALENVAGVEYLVVQLLPHSTAPLRVGQVVDLVLTLDGQDVTIRGLMIARFDPQAPSFSVEVTANAALQRYLDELLDPANTVHWQNCPYWLRDFEFQLVYADDQEGLAADERRLTSSEQSPYPAFAKVGSRIVIEPVALAKAAQDKASSRAALVAEVVDVDSFANELVVRRISGSTFPPVDSALQHIWYLDATQKATQDNFSFLISVVFDRDLLMALAADPYAAKDWIESVLLDEMPAHLCVVMHWLPHEVFRSFGAAYNRWQNNGAPLGDDAYALLNLLTLGALPTEVLGIGGLHIATPEQKELAVGPGDDEWHADVVAGEALFHVSPLDGKSPPGT